MQVGVCGWHSQEQAHVLPQARARVPLPAGWRPFPRSPVFSLGAVSVVLGASFRLLGCWLQEPLRGSPAYREPQLSGSWGPLGPPVFSLPPPKEPSSEVQEAGPLAGCAPPSALKLDERVLCHVHMHPLLASKTTRVEFALLPVVFAEMLAVLDRQAPLSVCAGPSLFF